LTARRFPPPLVGELDACFVVRDHSEHARQSGVALEAVNCHSCHPRHHGDSDQEDKRLDARFCHCHPPRRLAVRISD
jgi:hypothetical protein